MKIYVKTITVGIDVPDFAQIIVREFDSQVVNAAAQIKNTARTSMGFYSSKLMKNDHPSGRQENTISATVVISVIPNSNKDELFAAIRDYFQQSGVQVSLTPFTDETSPEPKAALSQCTM